MALPVARWRYAALALATIALGLLVHRGIVPMGPRARDMAGDALWAAMMAWWVGALAPRARRLPRSAVALGICAAVEFSQLIHAPPMDAVRDSTVGHLILGSGFDPRDFAAYAIGIVVAALLETWLARQGAWLATPPQ